MLNVFTQQYWLLCGPAIKWQLIQSVPDFVNDDWLRNKRVHVMTDMTS